MAGLSWASWISGVAVAAVFAMPAVAEDRRALVIAGSADGRDTAVTMSETLLGLGFTVDRLENPDAADLSDAVEALQQATGPTVLYTSSAIDDLDALLVQTGDSPRFVFLDACDVDLPDAPDGVMVVVSADCAMDFASDLLGQLTVPGLPTDQWALGDGYQVQQGLAEPFVFRTPTSDIRLTAADYAMLDTLSPAARDRMIALWRKAGIAVDAVPTTQVETVRLAPVSPVAPAAVVRPIAPQVTGAVAPVRDSVSILTRPLVSTPTVTPGASGLPQPSILVGYVVENLPDAPVVPNEPLAGAGFGSDDVAAREALRDQDADAFVGLVAAGAFDPPEGQIARALQVELARINCYTSGIDGAWGPGSQRALLAFYEEIGAVPPGSEADLDAFRAVIARDDIRCPDPVPVTRTVSAPAPSAPARSTRPAPAAAPAPAPAPAAPAPAQTNRRSISQTSGTGVFR